MDTIFYKTKSNFLTFFLAKVHFRRGISFCNWCHEAQSTNCQPIWRNFSTLFDVKKWLSTFVAEWIHGVDGRSLKNQHQSRIEGTTKKRNRQLIGKPDFITYEYLVLQNVTTKSYTQNFLKWCKGHQFIQTNWCMYLKN